MRGESDRGDDGTEYIEELFALSKYDSRIATRVDNLARGRWHSFVGRHECSFWCGCGCRCWDSRL